MSKETKKHYLVSAAYVGECCPRPHIWVEYVRADTAADARAKMEAKMKRKQIDPGDFVVTEITEKHKEHTVFSWQGGR